MSQVRAVVVRRQESGDVVAGIEQITRDMLPPGDVLIQVAYSSLNYKDALAVRGHSGVVRTLPHVPGIDAAGRVLESNTDRVRPGDEVIVTGFELGAGHWGGYAQLVRVPADWVLPLPSGLSLRDSMIYGTAGFTAGLCVDTLQQHGIDPAAGPVLVTGASGGVGSLGVAILARCGYHVAGSSGKPQAAELLKELGAKEILSREDVNDTSNRPLLSARWAGVLDGVGGNALATVLKSTLRGGCVAAYGLVGGAELSLTVYPFLLRGVTLAGIDSAFPPPARRIAVWEKLAGPWRPEGLERLAHEITLDQLPENVTGILAGQTLGRIVVRVGEGAESA